MTTNCIKFTSADIETAKGVGSISTLTFDLDITVEPVASANPMAPTHRVLGRSPRGKLVECGGIWKKQNKETGADYYTLTIRDHGFNANLEGLKLADIPLDAIPLFEIDGGWNVSGGEESVVRNPRHNSPVFCLADGRIVGPDLIVSEKQWTAWP